MPKYLTKVIKVLIPGSKKQKTVNQMQFYVMPTKYSGEQLRKLRAERGVGNIRNINKGAA